ncbi:uncharacterized protein LOC110696493 [Chenopodium quinoa]|uniref:uncharacterized protein LOC110696493 n=1 Tax=Chenopodium quinoa TaxID=63459 RepID=UPI000B79573B|nr:uncharacterized protein LOC110696493 [Chenopodium quinoa]
MEYLSRCLFELTKFPDFNFHQRCERLSITHLMFADDLLLFTRADECSVRLMFKAFQKFSRASGLEANLLKSEVYFRGVSTELQNTLLESLGMFAGAIPFKYLGVPLSSKKLTIQQCKPLVNKIASRIEGWASRFLSYSGSYYFRSVNFWDADIPKKSSWVLRRILKYRELIDEIGGWDSILKNNRVQIKLIYKNLRQQSPKVPWKRLICNNGASPRCIFILWLASWNRLLTKDRVLKWNPSCDLVCMLCLQENEDVHHLFFLYTFSRRIWGKDLQLLKCNKPVQGFNQELEWAIKYSRKSTLTARFHECGVH